MTSYGFVINFYPIYDMLEEKSRNWTSMMSAAIISIIITLFVYTCFTLLCIEAFGYFNSHSNIFSNFDDSMGIMSIAVRIIFLIMLLSAIPFPSFATKMCILTLIEELRDRKISHAMGNNEVYNIAENTSDCVNIVVVVLMQLIITAIAIPVDNLTMAFSVPAALSESLANAILPGLFLFSTAFMIKQKLSTTSFILQMVSGIAMFVLGVTFTTLALTSAFLG